MSITYWSIKQAPLKPEEVDKNFEYLEKKLGEIYKLLKETPSLTGIELKEGRLFFKGNDGSEFPPIKLSSWIPRGKWDNNTFYENGDVVYYDNKLHLCQSPCRNSHPSRKEHWILVFSLDE